jgi:hypothetical protein
MEVKEDPGEEIVDEDGEEDDEDKEEESGKGCECNPFSLFSPIIAQLELVLFTPYSSS